MKISISKMQQQVLYYTSQIPHVEFHFLQTVHFCPQIILCNFTSAGVCYQFLNFLPQFPSSISFDNKSPLLEHSKEAIWQILTFSFSIFLRVHVQIDKSSIFKSSNWEAVIAIITSEIHFAARLYHWACSLGLEHAKTSNVHGWHLSRSIQKYPSN